jgi:hypothetical protein
MIFKGGTSLSKGFGLISRFSEDIDIVVSPLGLWERGEVQGLGELKRKEQQAAFEELRSACERYVANELREHLQNEIANRGLRADVSQDDSDKQTLLIAYPSSYTAVAGYVHPVVRVECGPRSAREPSRLANVEPLLVTAVRTTGLRTVDIPTIAPERTFWEKVLILHGHHCRFRDERVVPQERNRLSRHYYDVAMLLSCEVGQHALADVQLLDSVRSHNQLAFPSAWRKYDEAVSGKFLLSPQPEVRKALEADYSEMQTMIFGDVPKLDWVLEQIILLEGRLNA